MPHPCVTTCSTVQRDVNQHNEGCGRICAEVVMERVTPVAHLETHASAEAVRNPASDTPISRFSPVRKAENKLIAIDIYIGCIKVHSRY